MGHPPPLLKDRLVALPSVHSALRFSVKRQANAGEWTRREFERYHRATVGGNEEALREVERSREAVCALRFERSHGVQSDLTPVFLTHSFPELFLRGYVEPET